jgi:uncharacterized membrane protein YkvA (DUF1232 family)
MFTGWKQRVWQLKTEVYALYLAYQDPRTPWYAKAVAALVVAYALSPIDLIPDFVPVLGYVDDLLLLPLGILLALRLIPAAVMADCRARAVAAERLPGSRLGLVMVIALWLLGMVIALRLIVGVGR